MTSSSKNLPENFFFIPLDFVNNFDATLDSIVDGLNKFGNKLIIFVDDVMEGFFDSKGQFNLIGGLTNYLTTALGAAFTILMEALLVAVPKFFGMLFSDPKVIGGLLKAFATLFALSSLYSIFSTAMMALWMSISGGMLSSWNALMLKMSAKGMTGGGNFFGGGKMKGVGNVLKIGGAVVAGGMVAKDAVDVFAGTDGGASGKNIGGAIGGTIGALGFFLGPLGGTIGMAAGNLIGNKIGSLFDKRDEKQEKKEQVAETKQQQQQQQIQYASVQQGNRGGLSLDFLDSAAGAESMDGMSVGERREIDATSNETKLLTLIAAELKMSNKKLGEIVDKPTV